MLQPLPCHRPFVLMMIKLLHVNAMMSTAFMFVLIANMDASLQNAYTAASDLCISVYIATLV